jgi:NAD(P)H-quinone oxidoreductase subunit 5
VGIVFIEIGLGWRWLAVAHILGNATVRTMQYLRAPSMLHDYHQMHSAVGGQLSATGTQIEEMLPERIRLWLYRWALDRGHLDTILEHWVIAPLLQVSAYLSRRDRTRMPSTTTVRTKRPVPVSVAGLTQRGD